MSNDGATVVPTEDRSGECMGRWKHNRTWHGFDSVMCSTCGLVTPVVLGMGLGSNAAQTRPTDADIVKGLAKQFNCPEAVASSWLNQMFVDHTRTVVKQEIAKHRPPVNGWLLTALRSPT